MDVQLYVTDKERGNVNWTFNFIVSVSFLMGLIIASYDNFIVIVNSSVK